MTGREIQEIKPCGPERKIGARGVEMPLLGFFFLFAAGMEFAEYFRSKKMKGTNHALEIDPRPRGHDHGRDLAREPQRDPESVDQRRLADPPVTPPIPPEPAIPATSPSQETPEKPAE